MQTRGRTGGRIHTKPFSGSGWSSQLLLWEQQILEELMKTTKEKADGGGSSARDNQETNHEQDSTPVPRIRVTKSLFQRTEAFTQSTSLYWPSSISRRVAKLCAEGPLSVSHATVRSLHQGVRGDKSSAIVILTRIQA